MNKIFTILFALLAFVMLYPMIEFNVDCPDAYTDLEGNTNCTTVKMVLWEVTAALSLYHWDGISTTAIPISPGDICCYNENVHTYAADEGSYKSIFPLLTILVMFFVATKLRYKKNYDSIDSKISGEYKDD